jgi:hypothetical protein
METLDLIDQVGQGGSEKVESCLGDGRGRWMGRGERGGSGEGALGYSTERGVVGHRDEKGSRGEGSTLQAEARNRIQNELAFGLHPFL